MGNMKKRVICLSLASVLATPSVSFAGLSEFVSSSIGGSFQNEQPGYFKSQTGGMLSAGQVRMRWGGGGNIQPFHISAPKFSAGCSGIDMIFGGFSYLNMDYLVEKLKKVASAAPAYAFQLAISTLCKDCQAIMAELEKITDMINGLNFDTCKIADNLTGKMFGDALNSTSYATDGWFSAMKEGLQSFNTTLDSYTSKIKTAVEGGNNAGQGANETIPEPPLKTFSLLDRVIELGTRDGRTPFSSVILQQIDPNPKVDGPLVTLLRGFFGDVVAYSDGNPHSKNGAQKDIEGNDAIPEYQVRLIEPTIDAKHFVEWMWGSNDENPPHKLSLIKYEFDKKDNEYVGKPKERNYEIVIQKTIREDVVENLKRIVNNISANTPISDADRKWIGSLPLPMADILNIEATEKGFSGDTIYEYAALLILKHNMTVLISEMNRVIKSTSGQTSQYIFQTQNKEKSDLHAAFNQFKASIDRANLEIDAKMKELSEELGKNKDALNYIEKSIQRFYGKHEIFNGPQGN